jgi:Trichohyalin-plectin-homology domain
MKKGEAIKLQKAKQVLDEETRQLEISNREKKENLKKELQRANEMSLQLKNQRFEEQRIAELKAQEYMNIKRAQRKQLEREATLAREVKQKAHDRMLKLQQQLINSKSKSQEVQYRLELEQVERDFRQKVCSLNTICK